MKIAEGFTLMNIVDTNVVVPVGEKNINFNGMITLSGSGAFLWKQLETDVTKEALLQSMLKEYDVDQVTAEADIDKFIAQLKNAELLE